MCMLTTMTSICYSSWLWLLELVLLDNMALQDFKLCRVKLNSPPHYFHDETLQYYQHKKSSTMYNYMRDHVMWCFVWQVLCTGVVEGITTHAAVPRPVLQLLKQKPKSIKFYEPKFDQVWVQYPVWWDKTLFVVDPIVCKPYPLIILEQM